MATPKTEVQKADEVAPMTGKTRKELMSILIRRQKAAESARRISPKLQSGFDRLANNIMMNTK